MTTEEIIKGNKLITEFMEIRFNENGTVCHHPTILPFHMGEDTILDCKFNSSWEWLMPVMDKIESLGYHFAIGDIWNAYGSEVLSYSDNYKSRYFEANSKLEAVWLTSINFIEWYNSQK